METRPHQLKIRIASELRSRIHQSAERNHRSMNAEIVHHLENALEAKMYVEPHSDAQRAGATREREEGLHHG